MKNNKTLWIIFIAALALTGIVCLIAFIGGPHTSDKTAGSNELVVTYDDQTKTFKLKKAQLSNGYVFASFKNGDEYFYVQFDNTLSVGNYTCGLFSKIVYIAYSNLSTGEEYIAYNADPKNKMRATCGGFSFELSSRSSNNRTFSGAFSLAEMVKDSKKCKADKMFAENVTFQFTLTQ